MTDTAKLVDLAKHLKEEKLFVASEKVQLQRLNEEVTTTAERLYHISWISRQQRQNLESLVLGASDVTPAACCYRANAFEQVNFVDAYKNIGYHDSAYGDFLKLLRENPKLVAYCLTQGEKMNVEGTQDIVKVIMAAVYGNCVMQEDERYVLLVLQSLIENQLGNSDDPRRLLRRSSCVFTTLFKQFTEGLYSGRLYLTASLHESVMALLMDDETYFETNPHKVVDHFSPQEQEKRFGKANTPEFQDRLLQHLEVNVDHLVNHCNKFISNLKDSMYCFPQSLDWLVRQIYKIVTHAGKIAPEEVQALCVDMLLLLFICPAIVNPEPYGIASDILISEVARFNLMQVAQILQALAMNVTGGDGRASDMCSRFPKDCMSSLLDSMINSLGTEDIPPVNQQLSGITRSSAMITERELYALVAYLRSVQASNPDQPESKELEAVLQCLPPTPNPTVTVSSPGHGGAESKTPSPTPPDTPQGSSKKTHGKGRKSLKGSQGLGFFDGEQQQENTSQQKDQAVVYQPEDVLVVPLGNVVNECPGMLSETKVLESAEAKTKSKSERENRSSPPLHAEMPEKQLRFSADASLVSDNLESMSIGASNSVYSMDLENISNTSGIENASCASGRNTPRSTASSSDAARALELLESEPHDISDRFGKFDIRPLVDKDKSQMDAAETWSETWSTDVLASDQSEPPPEHNQIERLQEIAEVQSEPPDYSGAQSLLYVRQPGEVSETASETWSVDVLQSDSEHCEERLHELDDGNDYGDLLDEKKGEECQDNKGDQDEQFFDAIDNSTKALESLATMNDPLENLGAVGGIGLLSADSAQYGGIPKVSVPTDDRQRPVNILAQSFMSLSTGKKDTQTDTKPEGVLDAFDPFAPTTENDIGAAAGGGGDAGGSSEGAPGTLHSHRDSGISTGASSVSPTSPDTMIATSPAIDNGLVNFGNTVETPPPIPPRRKNPFDKEATKSHSYPAQGAAQNEFNAQMPGKQMDGSGMLIPDGAAAPVELGNGDVSKSRASSSSSTSSNSSGSGTNRMTDASSSDVQKSISFDNSVELSGHQDKEGGDNADKGNKSWWKKKLPFKVPSRKSKGGKTPDREKEHSSPFFHSPFFHHESPHHHGPSFPRQHQGDGDSVKPPMPMPGPGSEDIMNKYKNMVIMGQNVEVADPDEILNKYRHKLASTDSPLVNFDPSLEATHQQHNEQHEPNDHPDGGVITGDHIESTYAFTDAKRKLRIVLCSADFHTLPWLTNFSSAALRVNAVQNDIVRQKDNNDNELVAFLKVQQAEAINLQDKALIAQLHETLRCVRQFDSEGSKKLLQSLKDDYINRAPYISYLIRCRRGLLATQAHLERLLERVERDKIVCNKYFTAQCVREFLERQEDAVHRFCNSFQALTVPDEKTDHVEEFLHHLYVWISQDPIWQAASEEQKEDAKIATERAIMSRIYKQALYPNGDGDILRDQVLHEHIKRLVKVVTATHKSLQIPEKYRKECPWPSAQAEILTINAYKTPKDKLQCVIRCCATIMNLLSMANENSVPGADDFVPVLVYVLIKANPPSLLSTVQYVNSFYDKRLSGEEQYWWMQFCAAIEFIKTIDDRK